MPPVAYKIGGLLNLSAEVLRPAEALVAADRSEGRGKAGGCMLNQQSRFGERHGD